MSDADRTRSVPVDGCLLCVRLDVVDRPGLILIKTQMFRGQAGGDAAPARRANSVASTGK